MFHFSYHATSIVARKYVRSSRIWMAGASLSFEPSEKVSVTMPARLACCVARRILPSHQQRRQIEISRKFVFNPFDCCCLRNSQISRSKRRNRRSHGSRSGADCRQQRPSVQLLLSKPIPRLPLVPSPFDACLSCPGLWLTRSLFCSVSLCIREELVSILQQAVVLGECNSRKP